MKRKYLVYAALVSVGLGLAGTGIASACGFGFWGLGASTLTPDQIASRQQTMFENEAQVLGISVDDVKAAWAQGKTMQRIMTEKNISQDQVNQRIKDRQLAQLKTQLQALVDKGVITQAQADQRLQTVQTKLESNNGKGGIRMFHRGFGGGL